MVIPVLISIAYFTLADRRLMAAVQRRTGPNVVGYGGFLQPFADGLKLLVKEVIVPHRASKFLFLIAPIVGLILSLVVWVVIPSAYNKPSIVIFQAPILFFSAVLSLSAYSVILGGWASNSLYGLFGALRAIGQIISFELPISFIIITLGLISGNYNFQVISELQVAGNWLCFFLLPFLLIYFVCALAETSRIPFDLPEAEAEIVAGYNIEYSSIIFSMFFLSEYAHMLFSSTLIVIFFFGGVTASSLYFSFKITCICFLFILVRSALPRYRYDQLMLLCWKFFIPFTLSFFLFVLGYLSFINGLPSSLC